MKQLKLPNNYFFYHLFSSLIVFFGNIYFGGKVVGRENILKSGKFILAGNHTGNFDSYLLFKASTRPIHIIAKKELFEGKFSFIFKQMHLIPVDRKTKNPIAKELAIEILNADKVLAIFPEGTFHKEDILLPFKPGVISFATKTNAPIIPFAIKGEFKFRSHPTIIIGKPIYLENVPSEDKLKYLENVIRDMLTK